MRRLLVIIVVCSGFLLNFVLATNLGMYVGTRAYIYKDAASAPNAEAALIPGAAILADGALSSIFIDRVDAAIALYRAGKVSKILVSGDNSTVSYNEVNPVRTYLILKGIPDEDIKKAIMLIETTSAKKKAVQQALWYESEAKRALAALPPSQSRLMLEEIVDFVGLREY